MCLQLQSSYSQNLQNWVWLIYGYFKLSDEEFILINTIEFKNGFNLNTQVFSKCHKHHFRLDVLWFWLHLDFKFRCSNKFQRSLFCAPGCFRYSLCIESSYKSNKIKGFATSMLTHRTLMEICFLPPYIVYSDSPLKCFLTNRQEDN